MSKKKIIEPALVFPQEQPVIVDRPQGFWTPMLGDELLHCPVCGHADVLDCFDCLGADKDCVFCNECQAEIRM